LRRLMLAVSLVAMLVFSAVPALADEGDDRWDVRSDDRLEERFFDGFFFNDEFEDFERFDFDGDFNQDVEQDAESGDVDQSFNVSQTGDNSNQCVGVQGVANTGNAQNVTDVTQLGAQEGDFDDSDRERFFFDDFGFFFDGFDRFDGDGGNVEFEEIGSTIEVSPTNTTSCDQQVNQAATATG
jgi:3',5'-cyclic AMP phosphodiesterase CpdA